MRCFVYKSLRKADTYLYLGQRDDFARLPASLRDSLGPLCFVLEFELAAGRRLARGDEAVVRQNLEAAGFHLQLPPGTNVPIQWSPEFGPHAQP